MPSACAVAIVGMDGDGLCDSDEVPGCMDGLARTTAGHRRQRDLRRRWLPETERLDTDDDGICDDNEIPGCMEVEACNFNPQATDNVGCYLLPVSTVLESASKTWMRTGCAMASRSSVHR